MEEKTRGAKTESADHAFRGISKKEFRWGFGVGSRAWYHFVQRRGGTSRREGRRRRRRSAIGAKARESIRRNMAQHLINAARALCKITKGLPVGRRVGRRAWYHFVQRRRVESRGRVVQDSDSGGLIGRAHGKAKATEHALQGSSKKEFEGEGGWKAGARYHFVQRRGRESRGGRRSCSLKAQA